MARERTVQQNVAGLLAKPVTESLVVEVIYGKPCYIFGYHGATMTYLVETLDAAMRDAKREAGLDD